MANYVLAHDLGTTGNKATLYDREGRLVGSAFFGYKTSYLHARWVEQNPDDWWQAVCTSTHALLAQTGIKGDDIACIAFSGQMMACAPLDAQAKPLRDAIIWADQRATEQIEWLGKRISFEEVYRITGHRLSESYSLPKMLWLRDHASGIYESAYKFMHAKDAVIARLTGEFVTDASDASGMILYDLATGDWSPELVAASEINPKQLPRLLRSIDVAGEVLARVADEVGVPAGTPVVVGGGDGVCASTGAGVIAEGEAYNYIGSSSWIALATPKALFDPDYRTFTYAHLVPGMFMPTGSMQAAGASYQWARDQLCYIEKQAAGTLDISPYELMNMEANQSPPGAKGLIYLPYLMGERTPYWNPNARGGFIGLTIRHTRQDMLRAILEGCTMHLRMILDAFREQGAQIHAMRLIGGGARGRFWNQLMADIYGIPVLRLTILEEATSMGAALAGGIGVGLYDSFGMVQSMNPVDEIFEPGQARQQLYEDSYRIFKAAYSALEPINERIARRFT